MSSNPTENTATPCSHTDYVHGPEREGLPATGEGTTGVERRVWDTLYAIEDPEMPVSIVDLGLIYGVSVEDGHADVKMTLTYTGCPAREMLTTDIEEAVAAVEGIDSMELDLVWSPPWTVEMVTEPGKEALREFGLSI
ncbi:1,2-phenylacetyl-CoA epoxidase subunit PaaD [Haladaptatus sp. CMSO5]|uniref:1,2-phenylacetyl-CoA epoxidase subunit PaaD n=1 Tax=Haladaptatus sp. CMSO5 TaxID=3120514 RepID=UPI002FCE621E